MDRRHHHHHHRQQQLQQHLSLLLLEDRTLGDGLGRGGGEVGCDADEVEASGQTEHERQVRPDVCERGRVCVCEGLARAKPIELAREGERERERETG